MSSLLKISSSSLRSSLSPMYKWIWGASGRYPCKR